MIIHLTVIFRTIKFLEEHIRENLGDVGFGDEFLDTTAKAGSIKEKNNKLDFIEIKKLLFCERHC